MSVRNVTVIGDGGWGTALALVATRNGHRVRVWGPFAEYIDDIRARGENVKFLPGVSLPANLSWTAEPAAAMADADVAVIAVPTKYFCAALERFKGLVPQSCRLVSVAKGLDLDSHRRMSEIAADILGHLPVAALSGPSHAEEVARSIPTAVTAASEDAALRAELQTVFTNTHFRVYTSSDIVGVELGGALKNVIAIAVGISDGMGFGDNTRAALITRGLAEISRLGCALGADPVTFSGLSGVGDLIVTCTSGLSRNRAVGERLGRGETLAQIMDGMQQATEGVWNCASARALAREAGVDVPLTDEVYEIVHEGKDPKAAVRALLSRKVKPE